jgi:RNA recognition motif-containing protein
VFLRNIPKAYKQADLHQLLEKHGEISKLMVSFDINHKSKGFGFVYYRTKESAQKAIEQGAHLDPE